MSPEIATIVERLVAAARDLPPPIRRDVAEFERQCGKAVALGYDSEPARVLAAFRMDLAELLDAVDREHLTERNDQHRADRVALDALEDQLIEAAGLTTGVAFLEADDDK